MLIGIPQETDPAQPLVSATPDTVAKLIKRGFDVQVQRGAGEASAYPDELYEQAGARLVGQEVWRADIVTCLDTPDREALNTLRTGATLIARMDPARNEDILTHLSERGITALAMDAIPRISRAQSMDVLSSMSNIAGYRAVIEAATAFGRLFTGQVTAAGKMPPATVYIIGAGVAGLAAIGTAHSMGAVVRATDLRPETAEQVESMGAEFVPIPAETEESTDGYATEMTTDQAAAAAELYAREAAGADIVITTANIPGTRAPLLLTRQNVERMAPGSVIVDMAAASGGNCELTRPGEVVTTAGGVTILGFKDLAGRLPTQASQLYGQNIVNLIDLLCPDRDGRFVMDLEDEIIRAITVTHDHHIYWPPPPVKVSQAQTPPEPPAAPEVVDEPKVASSRIWYLLGAAAAVALVLSSPLAVASHYIVLLLAIVVGFYVITAVTHSLHTPLMSETNAISGIVILGAIAQVGSTNLLVSALSFVAITIASINIFGGFSVTSRMLTMFRQEG
ncbi:NAD(P) transhydrogenase subunit alpha [Corynebacterium ciconiae DSM 44920]|uniref:Re/Si-specific NAD(P)(+) transhydrogenase subunit alpha n=1 Tax=Corynebacterium ciconiae TaxID=227319 RepID=UPI000374B23C|nr:Re/Si-specific NAD(P)(+) transhydrogenase subunit alpha [Corynebacterium ciconiae]WKD60615.1 NAD(P) transhydrogenase subunit alpha [Corynebacterium ciconiae DSM 44920]